MYLQFHQTHYPKLCRSNINPRCNCIESLSSLKSIHWIQESSTVIAVLFWSWIRMIPAELSPLEWLLWTCNHCCCSFTGLAMDVAAMKVKEFTVENSSKEACYLILLHGRNKNVQSKSERFSYSKKERFSCSRNVTLNVRQHGTQWCEQISCCRINMFLFQAIEALRSTTKI